MVGVSRYSAYLRAQPVGGLVVGLVAFAAALLFGVDAWAITHGHVTALGGSAAASILVVFLALILCAFMFGVTRAMWFLVYEYKLSDGRLDVRDPILRSSQSVGIADIERVETFFIPLGMIGRKAMIGHVLVARDGRRIRLSEALPIWDSISSACAGISIEQGCKPIGK